MDVVKRDRFIALWRRFFNDAELPITFYYSKDDCRIPLVQEAKGHTCIIAQLLKVRRGESLCFSESSIGCGGGKHYLGYKEVVNGRFNYFLSHGEEGEYGERYKRTPGQVEAIMKELPLLPREGDFIVFKRWDRLEEEDRPEVVVFMGKPDVISGLFTWVNFDSTVSDAVIAPFGAGCASMIYHPYREQIEGRKRAVIGMFDPSARKCMDADLLSLAIPMNKFMEMIDQMDESFLITDTWTKIQRRI